MQGGSAMGSSKGIRISRQKGMVGLGNIQAGSYTDSPVSLEFEIDELKRQEAREAQAREHVAPLDEYDPGEDLKLHLARFYAKEGDDKALDSIIQQIAIGMGMRVIREVVHKELRPLRLVKLHVALKQLELLTLSDKCIAEECGVTVRTVEETRRKIKDLIPPITRNFGL